MTDQSLLLLTALVAVITVLGICYALFGNKLTQDKSTRKRLGYPEVKATAERAQKVDRRKSIEDSLKEIDERRKARKNLTTKQKIQRAGKTWPVASFHLFFVGLAAMVAIILLMSGNKPLVAGLFAFVIAIGFPRLVLSQLIKRREAAFIQHFPGAIDVLVRGVRTGLPINECLNVIASEIPEPVSTEFKLLTDGLAVGVSLNEGLRRMFDRLPLPEVNFFAVVLIIQKQTGGNLAEALSNLSNVLRERKKLKQKIKALSSEAKASAYVIGSLPFLVGTMVYITSPGYMDILFFSSKGQLILVAAGIWMSIGVFVMRGMMNFKV